MVTPTARPRPPSTVHAGTTAMQLVISTMASTRLRSARVTAEGMMAGGHARTSRARHATTTCSRRRAVMLIMLHASWISRLYLAWWPVCSMYARPPERTDVLFLIF